MLSLLLSFKCKHMTMMTLYVVFVLNFCGSAPDSVHTGVNYESVFPKYGQC